MLFWREIEDDDEEDTSHWFVSVIGLAFVAIVAPNDILEDVETGEPATECG